MGRLTVQKNYEAALQAVAQLNDLNFQYLIAGQGEEHPRLESLIESLGLQHRVRLLGFVEDISEILRLADVFLIPSLWEGFGMAAVEAMNASLPVVASDVPGLRDVVEHTPPCALLVNPDSPESIASALRDLLSSSERRQQLGRNAFVASMRFSEERMIEGYLELYREMGNSMAQ